MTHEIAWLKVLSCPIYAKYGTFSSEAMLLVGLVDATSSGSRIGTGRDHMCHDNQTENHNNRFFLCKLTIECWGEENTDLLLFH